jgi:hypothetical protein
LEITATVTIDNVEVSDTYIGRIEGETFTSAFRDQITSYLENPDADQASPTVRSELGSNKIFRVIAYRETTYRHFYPSIYGIPKAARYPRENSTGDGGLGVMQLTEPTPNYTQIWHYRNNIDAGVDLVKSKLVEAKNWHNVVRMGCDTCRPIIDRAYPEAEPLSQGRQLKMDVYSLYNSGYHYWKWNSLEKAWFPRLGGNPPAGTGSFYAQKAEQMEINSPIDF